MASECTGKGISTELRLTFAIVVPTLIRLSFCQLADRFTIGFVGHYDGSPQHIDGFVLGKMYLDICGASIGLGLSIGVATFASINTGRGTSQWNGVVFRRCMQVFAGCFVFTVISCWFSTPVLAFLGQPPEVLEPCNQFLLVAMLGMPALWINSSIQSCLIAQNIVIPSMFTDGFASLCNLVVAFLFLAKVGTGFIGVAWSSVISYWVSVLLLCIYVVAAGKQNTIWQVPNEPVPARQQCSFKLFLRTSVPSALGMWVEWWAAEIMAVLAGLLPDGTSTVGAHGLLFNTAAIFYMAFVANSMAALTRVGQLVGAQEPGKIKVAISVGAALSLVLAAIISAVLYFYGPVIMELYTDEPGILGQADNANLGMVLTIAPYSLMMFLLGVLRGCDLQMWGAAAMAVAFYFIGTPLSLYLGLDAGQGLVGVWYGNATGMAVSALAIAVKICTVDWFALVKEKSAQEEKEAPLMDEAAKARRRSSTCSEVMAAELNHHI